MNLRSVLKDVAEKKWKETIDHLVRSHRQVIHSPLLKCIPAKVIQKNGGWSRVVRVGDYASSPISVVAFVIF